jgi:hypothetical protein
MAATSVGGISGSLLEPVLDEVVVARYHKREVQVAVELRAAHALQADAKVLVHEHGRPVLEDGVAVVAVERHDLVAVLAEHLHAGDHRMRGLELGLVELHAERGVVDRPHGVEKAGLELLHHVLDGPS